MWKQYKLRIMNIEHIVMPIILIGQNKASSMDQKLEHAPSQIYHLKFLTKQ